MNKNKDPRSILISRENYEQLVYLAHCGVNDGAGTAEELKRIVDHARKFNPAYSAEIRARRLAEEKGWRERRDRTIAFLRSGVRNAFLKYANHPYLTPVEIVGKSPRSKIEVRVRHTTAEYKGRNNSFPVDSFILAPPEGWQRLESGKYKDCFAPPQYNPVLDEDIARAEQELKGTPRGTDSGT